MTDSAKEGAQKHVNISPTTVAATAGAAFGVGLILSLFQARRSRQPLEQFSLPGN